MSQSLFFFTSLTLRFCRTQSLDVDWPNTFHVVVFTDAETFEPEEPIKKAAAPLVDKWEGEDEDEDVKVTLIYRDRCLFAFEQGFESAVVCPVGIETAVRV